MSEEEGIKFVKGALRSHQVGRQLGRCDSHGGAHRQGRAEASIPARPELRWARQAVEVVVMTVVGT
jgi:hypothetical protein